ncbi:MAG: hypothetical protein LBV09_03490 [Deferribacteraceae bacterium]|jgi:methionyl-tRNA formyltransferase|nr:hypothetical protein [Deferribacteraceae bacterium]
MKKVLFLGYSREKTSLIGALEAHNCYVYQTEEVLTRSDQWDLVISFGYRHILSKKLIAELAAPIVNLHTSYLPYNKGAHPNFWAFYDNTPHGVTIHEIDEKLDTGAIIFQKQITFAPDENTFSKTYQRLFNEIETLFIDNIDTILSCKWIATPQEGRGTYHRASELPDGIDWNADIKEYLRGLK